MNHFASLVENLASAEWVRFSLDAASADTHKVVHASRSRDFEKACSAIEALSKYPVTVGISYVIQKPNLHEVESVVLLGKELGADYVRLAGVVFEADRVGKRRRRKLRLIWKLKANRRGRHNG